MTHTNLDNEINGTKRSTGYLLVATAFFILAIFWLYVLFFMPREADPNLPTVNTITGPVLNEKNQADVWCEQNPSQCKG